MAFSLTPVAEPMEEPPRRPTEIDPPTMPVPEIFPPAQSDPDSPPPAPPPTERPPIVAASFNRAKRNTREDADMLDTPQMDSDALDQGMSGSPISAEPEGAEIQSLIEDLRRETEKLVRLLEERSGARRMNGLQHGAMAMESAACTALSLVMPSQWIEQGTRFVRAVPVVSVGFSALLAWTAASMVRRRSPV